MDLTQQLRTRLHSLTAAGIEWIPVGTPIERKIISPAITSDTPRTPATATPITPTDQRKIALQQLAIEVSKCDRCPELFSTRTQTVFGVGPLSPDVCFVGEAPGYDEDIQGEPFVGKAGQFLTRVINGSGFQRGEVYICNTLKCRPPGNATPTPKQCENCRPFFESQIDLVQPKVICCLGNVAAKNVLNATQGITKLRGQTYRYRGIPVVCTWHPSYVIRQEGDALQKTKGEVWEDMKAILRMLGRPIPGSS